MRFLLILVIFAFVNSCKTIPDSVKEHQIPITIKRCEIPNLPKLNKIPDYPDFKNMPDVTTQEQIDQILVDYIKTLRYQIESDRASMERYHQTLKLRCLE